MDPQRALGGRLVGHLLAKRFLVIFVYFGDPQTRERRLRGSPLGAW